MKPSRYGSGAMCKKMGGKRGLALTDSELRLWCDISIRVQKEICIWKIENYKEVRDDLLHLFALKMRKGNVTFHSFTPTKWAF
jgi:hypothetical protein